MSLLANAMTDCQLYDKRRTADGYGTQDTTWIPGMIFKAAIVLDNSLQARTAAKQGVTELYTITTSKGITLEYHDVFRRLEDGKLFRVTSDGNDKKTPAEAKLDMRQVSAETWVLNGKEQISGD
jgi:hypothetical protein